MTENNTQEQTTEENAPQTEQQVETNTYLDGKYKSVSDLENGYRELQSSYSKKLGAFTGSPEDGYTLPEGIEENDQLYGLVSKWGKDNQLSNDGLNSLISEYQKLNEEQNEAYIKEQQELLGENAKTRIDNAIDFLKGTIGEEYTNSLDEVFGGAKGIEAIEKLQSIIQQGNSPANIPTQQTISPEKIQEMRFAKDEFGNRKMSVDPEYRAKVLKLEESLTGE